MVDLVRRRCHPCCGFYLKGAVKWICYMNFIIIFAGVPILVRHMYDLWFTTKEINSHDTKRIYYLCTFWCHAFVGWLIDLYLFKASRLVCIRGLMLWMVATFVSISLFAIVYYYFSFYFGMHVESVNVITGYILYRVYTLCVAYCYVKEIKEDANSLENCRNLTDKEIEEFQVGMKPTHRKIYIHPNGQNPDNPETLLATMVQFQRYKKEDHEIPMNSLLIDNAQILGAGAFGKVHRGQLVSFNGSSEPQIVAIKTINHENSNVSLFKTLLSELKIMSYLGRHEHIVSLIGACTAEIKYKKLFIVVELCAFGSLFEYLRCNVGMFFSQVKDHIIINAREVDYDGFERHDVMTTKDLLQWCYQTADGMAYLESKKVIHGDLATRNILLTSENNVKITDFGLSRQLYHYDVYAKKQNTPLPWRWLALESITDMDFSSKSDVWSFGVTVWEIFSMGEAPWPDRSFTPEFVRDLKSGIRMTIPNRCTHSIYNMLLHCWHQEPRRRPSFTALNEYFKKTYNYII